MEQKHQFPTEEVTLPSKGLLYPEGSPLKKGVIEMKYMTAREEDILTNQNYIEKGTVIDKLLKSLIVTPINYNDLLLGDKNAILIAARILGYGKDYEFEHNGESHTVDLTTIEDKPLNEELKNCFGYFKSEFEILKNLKIIVALGKIAFDTCVKFYRENFNYTERVKFGHGTYFKLPNNVLLMGCYHPSPRNVNTGRINQNKMVKLLNNIKEIL